MLEIINKLTTRQVAYIMTAVACVVFFTCLNNPFQGDDATQIVNNLPVHFIQNIGFFFTSSTFFNGDALVGSYYRPTMTTTFSLLYTLFGTWTVAYHVFQIALFTTGAFVLYLFLKHFLKQVPAFLLALLFLVHPMNSQIVFSIACMQDALLFLFGISALYVLVHYRSTKSLLAVAALLTLALFSKESGLAYPVMAFAYLLLFDRKRIWTLARIVVLPFIIYVLLKTHAVGLLVANAQGAPIDNLSLLGRLLTAPSIVLFYASKFVFPWDLATCWYWTHPTLSVTGVLVPTIVDLAIVGLFVYFGLRVHRKLGKIKFRTYLFFAGWAVLGLLPYLQFTPLDMTACETWFCFSMVGVLAMIGIALMTVKIPKRRLHPEWIVIIVLVLIAVLGLRTAIRGTDYSSQYSIAVHDLAVSKDDYSAMNNIAQEYIHQNRFNEAKDMAQKSIDIFPGVGNYDNLGVALQQTGDYPGAIKAYKEALNHGTMALVYENLGAMYLADWNSPSTDQFFKKALELYPKNSKLWSYKAIMEGAKGNNPGARIAILNAAKYGQVPRALYASIMAHTPLEFDLPTPKTHIVIP